MTIHGTESDLNAAFEGMTFTPTANFSGAVNLQMTTSLGADLVGHYTFDAGNATDDSVGVSQDGSLVGDATTVIDGTRGQVLSLDGDDDYVSIASTFGDPTNLTVAAWVNIDTSVGSSNGDIISVGDTFVLRTNNLGELRIVYNNSAGLQIVDSGIVLPSGWQHVAASFNDVTDQVDIFLDGSNILTQTVTTSLEYSLATTTYIGANQSSSVFDILGLIDDARVYTRAISADEIVNLAAENTSTSGSVAITVDSVNDVPTLTSFAAVVETTNEDREVEISFADLAAQGNEADVDGTVDAFVVKSIATGTLKIGTSAGTATAWAAGTNDTIDATNHAYWTSAGDANGTLNAFAAVAKDNQGAESVSNITAQVSVTSVNDPPTLTSFAAVVETTNEDTEVEISFADLIAQGDEADIDGTVDAFVVKSIAAGTLKIGTSAGTATAWAAGTNDTIDATNHAYWTPVGDANGTQNSFAVVAEDNQGAESASNITAQVSVTAVNDDPTNAGSLPTDIAVTEDVSSNVDLSAVDFSDVDAVVGSLTVTLTTSTGGDLTGAAAAGITLGGTPTAFTVSGSLTDLNTYFNTASNITYLYGTAHTNGDNVDTIQVEINDNGNTGTGGGTDIDLGTVNVDISAVNDDPTNAGSLPSDINGTEDVSSNVDLAAVDFSDVDAAAGSLTVTLTTSTGGDLTAVAGTGITLGGTPTALTVSGNLTDLNNYFNTASNITYLHGTAHTNGDNADTIQVNLNDNGNTGTGGGTDIDLGTVNVDITAVNDIPTLTSFAAVVGTTNEDTEVGISIADLVAQGDEADLDGTVDAFVVKSIGTGTLKIGASVGAATAWAAGTNDTIDATNHAYWTPAADANGTLNAFTVVAEDNLGAESAGNITVQVSVTSVNDPPILTSFAAEVETTDEDTEVEISFTDLVAQGDEGDTDGTVDAFVVKSIATGTLKIGTSAGTATAWAAGTNNTVDATNHAYWTPAGGANGTQNAFAVVAEDNQGSESASTILAQVSVTSINDEETLTTNRGLTVNEGDANTIITRLMLETTDIDSTPNQLEYTVTSAPVFGALRLSGSPLLGGAKFYQSDINAGLLTYSHNGSEVFTDSFWFTVNDGAGTVSGGTFGIAINPINDNDPIITSDGGGRIGCCQRPREFDRCHNSHGSGHRSAGSDAELFHLWRK